MELKPNTIYNGDTLETLKTFPDESVDCVVTSPPYYGLRDYGVAGQIGLEKTPEEYVAKMVEVFRESRRVLKEEGTLWLNLGDTYSAQRWSGGGGQPMNKNRDTHRSGNHAKNSGLPDKNLIGIPWHVAFALQADGWYLRQDIIWHKPNPMPESVTDRCTKAHEYIFLLSKSPKYYFHYEAIKERSVTNENRDFGIRRDRELDYDSKEKKLRSSVKRGGFQGKTNLMKGRESFRAITEMRNKRSVWTVTTKPYKGAHFATFPPDLIEPMIKAGCPAGGIVLDPFMGSGTTAYVARSLGRNYVGVELNPAYITLADKRLEQQVLV